MIKEITKTLQTYTEHFPEDKIAVGKLLKLIEMKANVTSRKELLGHITCGAILLNKHCQLLLIHHIALNRWLFPGGHLEDDDLTLKRAALRELYEETGINSASIIPFANWPDDIPIHIDFHSIPPSQSKGEPEHKHWDFRFLFKTNETAIQLQENEVKNFKWLELEKAPRTLISRIKSLGIISGDNDGPII